MIKGLKSVSLLDILPSNLLEDPQVSAAAKALDAELQAVTKATAEILHLPRLDELPETVVDLLAWQWHVDFYEPLDMSIETKRRLIRESIAWHKIKGTPAAVEKVLSAAFANAHVEEWYEYGGEPGHFRVTIEDVITDPEKQANIRAAIYSAKNERSWLDALLYMLVLEDGVLSEENLRRFLHEDEWAADLLAAFKDEVPYGRNITAYKYDSTLQYGGLVAYDNHWQYDGAVAYSGIISGCPQYSEELEWLFRYTGKAPADGEFQYNGAIRYDGLRPYRLEYSDGIDELGVLVLMLGDPGKEAFEDDVLTPMQYNGYGQYDGTLHGGGNPSPMDACGGLEITRAHRYDGSIRYDGGDINYFDGSFQYDGLFRYDGGGTHYRVDHYTDDLDGGLTLATHQKRPPLAMFHPELEDAMVVVSETYGAMTAETAFEDDMQGLLRFDGAVRYDGAANAGLVNLPVDAGGTITVIECHHYDGSMDYSGGFSRHYDGAMQYDGTAQIEGGNRFVIVQRYSETL